MPERDVLSDQCAAAWEGRRCVWPVNHGGCHTWEDGPHVGCDERACECITTERDRLRAENTWLRNQMGDVRGMQSDGATPEEMDEALGRALPIDETNAPKGT